MTTPREARRALARGDVDEALVLLWNAIEPLRLRGDEAGLESVAHMAAAIAEGGDGSQAREAGRLLDATHEMLGAADPPDTVLIGQAASGSVEPVAGERLPDPPGEVGAPPGREVPPEPAGRRVSRLVWALVVGAFIVFNILRGLLSE
jgi:hypothetical protein